VTDTIEGLLQVEPEGATLQPCDAGGPAWVIESAGVDLRSAAAGFGVGSGTPLRARVVGEFVNSPETGPGSDRALAIRVVQWVYLAEDTSGCAPEWDSSAEPASGGAENRPSENERIRPRVDGSGPDG